MRYIITVAQRIFFLLLAGVILFSSPLTSVLLGFTKVNDWFSWVLERMK